MINQNLNPGQVVDFLNQVLVLDRAGISELFSKRVECSEQLAAHPTVQVSSKDGKDTVGMLGLINGMFGVFDDGTKKNWGPIYCEVDEDTNLISSFGLVVNERKTVKPPFISYYYDLKNYNPKNLESYNCETQGHVTCGIPAKTCLRCGKRWLTGDDTTPENEIVSCNIIKRSEAFCDCYVDMASVVYKIPRGEKC
jgi:hypothetical protein